MSGQQASVQPGSWRRSVYLVIDEAQSGRGQASVLLLDQQGLCESSLSWMGKGVPAASSDLEQRGRWVHLTYTNDSRSSGLSRIQCRQPTPERSALCPALH